MRRNSPGRAESGRCPFRILGTSSSGGRSDVLKKGMHVRELTKKLGQVGRTGMVVRVDGENVEVRWDDGRLSSLSGALLRPVKKEKAG